MLASEIFTHEALPREAVQAVRLLFSADRHQPLLKYTPDGSGAMICCARCAAAIRWQWENGAWHPDTSGYVAGRRCTPRATQPPALNPTLQADGQGC